MWPIHSTAHRHCHVELQEYNVIVYQEPCTFGHISAAAAARETSAAAATCEPTHKVLVDCQLCRLKLCNMC